MNERDQWGRSVYRANDPPHNAITHILDWDARGGELVRNIVFSEPSGPPAPPGTVIGTRPGEIEVASAEFDYRLEHDPDVYKHLEAFHELWNVEDTQPCTCGCGERKRRGVMALRRAAQAAEVIADYDAVDEQQREVLNLSPEAEALAVVEARTRSCTPVAVAEVALRSLAVDYNHPRRESLLPFALIEDATAALSADLGMGFRFTPDAVDVIAWVTRLRWDGFTYENILSRAVERFCVLPKSRRDDEWGTHTSEY